MIIANCFKNITEYLDLGKETYKSPVYGCKFCGYEGMLHRHGYYSRNVITKYSFHRVNILRVKCPSCGKTHAVLPSFLIPYYQYSLGFIFECLYLSLVMKNSYSRIVDLFHSLNPYSSFTVSNVSSFKKRMKENKSIINSFLLTWKPSITIWIGLVYHLSLRKLKSFQRIFKILILPSLKPCPDIFSPKFNLIFQGISMSIFKVYLV